MFITEKDMKNIRNLVGNDITADNLKYVDVYVSDKLGIFIPSIGFCEYAIKPNHSHPSYSFVIFFSNEQKMLDIKFQVPDSYYITTAMSPKISHEEKKDDTFNRYIAIFINADFFNEQYILYDFNKPKNYFWDQFIVKKDIINFIKKFISEYEGNTLGKDKLLDSLSLIITHELIRSMLKLDNIKDITLKKNEIQISIDYMNQHFEEKITLDSLSNLTNISKSNFNRVFKKETGISPIEYLINIRLVKAKKFLREKNINITEISAKCGFYSCSHFSACFTKQLGLSPSDYHSYFNK
ncbi:helix-turn-helix domain-containing protein [Clostridium saccharobutylicum]|uniref:Transcriptional regulator, AraC family n=2 Tax=Clostridium saccharobutylicum TaxID=169679 RepID=U5MPS7_CLOSA|nr:response regulator transcription factor [Clostridium saccharobutylicum]AGX42814.1 transcriptional regulator, AraC family [Clostridium saccharobutylicum DSM 13864]AQR90111.1 HTH-type transcriptional activator RhaS [Clostridium saccharobutylicum]AQS00017.1 HTH-type transcriptional activator RhaS [Clostridium saccharobutylicum]AQS09802.1 HTH-type transcriptional activator RhaS [Clostridium saccharobutylicum]AQS14000.1 HTH-type transcriptional activator RhaS [Clostridium saccharobutylicum]